MCDSTLKLELIGINLQVNLNLNFRSKPEFKLTLTCVAAWGSPIAAAARQPRGGDSDCQYWVVEWRTLTPAAALRPRLRVPNCRCWVAVQLELPAGQVEWSKGHCSDCQYWVISMARASWLTRRARLTQASRCAAAQTAGVWSSQELPVGKLSEDIADSSITRGSSGIQRTSYRKSQQITGSNFMEFRILIFLIFFNINFNPNFLDSFFYSFIYFITY